MAITPDIKALIETINRHAKGDDLQDRDQFWDSAGAKLLTYIDDIILNPSKVNAITPKDFCEQNTCILAAIFIVLENIEDVNKPVRRDSESTIETSRQGNESNFFGVNRISFYELAFSRCCSFVCQLLGDRFQYVQKLLIKHIFGQSNVCSLFASDLYMFVMRIVHPNRRMAMCQIIMNLCKLAPPEALVKGAALINRIKDPVINFENPKYQFLLDL